MYIALSSVQVVISDGSWLELQNYYSILLTLILKKKNKL